MFARQFARLAGRFVTRNNATSFVRGLRAFSVASNRSILVSNKSYFKAAAAAVAGVSLATYSLTDLRRSVYAEEPVPAEGLPGTIHERSFIAIKPDGVERALIGEIIHRFEKKGYKLVALKMIWPTKELAAGHYADLAARPFFPGLVEYFSSGPIIAMVWEGHNVIKGGRKLVGATNPDDSAPGSIRGDLCLSVGRNIIHGSDSADSAKHEINYWFTAAEISNWDRAQDKFIYEKRK